jgi:hypothetical protein
MRNKQTTTPQLAESIQRARKRAWRLYQIVR